MSGFYSFITGAYSFITNFIFGRIIFQGIKCFNMQNKKKIEKCTHPFSVTLVFRWHVNTIECVGRCWPGTKCQHGIQAINQDTLGALCATGPAASSGVATTTQTSR